MDGLVRDLYHGFWLELGLGFRLNGGRPVFVAGRYQRGGQGVVTVSGLLAGRRFEQKVRVTLPGVPIPGNAAVAYLWARRRIADQMDVWATEPNGDLLPGERRFTLID